MTSGTGGTAVLNWQRHGDVHADANFNGAASFSYTASDGSATSNTATVTVNVAAVNDAPVANDDTLATTEDTPVIYTAAQLLGNDTDVDGNALTIASVTSGDRRHAVLNRRRHGDVHAGGQLQRRGELQLHGDRRPGHQQHRDGDGQRRSGQRRSGGEQRHAGGDRGHAGRSIRRRSCWATTPTSTGNAQLTIASVTSGTGGTAVLNGDGTVTFTPTANFNGAASFSYTASDGAATSNTATVTVNVAAVNDAPVANNDTLAATEDTPVIYTAAQLLGNDTDVDGNPLTIASVTSGTGGTAVLNGDGTVTFTPSGELQRRGELQLHGERWRWPPATPRP